MNADKNIDMFLSIFNQIDKRIDQILDLWVFVNFNEKLKMISQWNFYITNFVKKYDHKLRFLAELRNHIVHWFWVWWVVYSYPTSEAINELQSIANSIINPVTCYQVFKRFVYTCSQDDFLKDVILQMQKFLYTNVPVYNSEWKFVWMLTESSIVYWMWLNDNKKIFDIDLIKVWDVNLENTNDIYAFIDFQKNIYEIEDLFSQNIQKRKRLWAVFITKNWSKDEPIEWIITSLDLPTINDKFFV